MGQQQLLLIVLSVILVGIALGVAINLFQANAIESNRSAISDDLLYYATKAREFYWRPSTLGGGNRSFSGITLPKLSKMASNANGRYFIVGSPTEDEIVIMGIGTVKVEDDTVQVQVIVNEAKNTFQIIH
jgi:hypothetical protein